MSVLESADREQRLERELAEARACLENQKKLLSAGRIIAAIATELGELEPLELDAGIARALSTFGAQMRMERAFVALFSRDRQKVDLAHEWSRDGLDRQAGWLRDVPVDHCGHCVHEILRGAAVPVDRMDDLPEAAAAERALFEQRGFRSFLLVPIVQRSQTLGVLGLATVSHEHPWLDSEVMLVRLLADIFAGALTRRRVSSDWSKFVDCLRGLGADSRTNIDQLTALAGEILGGASALYNRLSEGRLCSWGQWCTPPEFPDSDAPEGHVCNEVIERARDEVVVLRDLASTPFATSDRNVARYGLQTYVGRGVAIKGEYVGALCVVFTRDYAPRREELVLFSAIADAVAVEEVRKRAQEELARSVAVLAATLESTADGILITDAKGGVLGYNRRYHEVWGTPRELQDDLPENLQLRLRQVKDPFAMASRILELNEHLDLHDFSRLDLLDGRVFERHSLPLLLDGKPIGRVWSVRDVSERARIEASHALLATAVEQAGEAVLITDDGGVVQYVNPAFERMTGWSLELLRQRTPRVLKSGRHDDAIYRALWSTISTGATWSGVLVNRRADGSLFKAAEVIAPVRRPDGRIANYVGILRDVTREEQLEEEVRQAQKMEAVGRLAGGIAHDFNNLLTAIIGSTDLVLAEVAAEEPHREELTEIRRAADRAATLTRQLLAFSRRQVLLPRVLDPSEILQGMIKMLGRLIPERVTVRAALDPAAGRILADPGQIEQVVLNLALNARDAMPRGGELLLATESVELPRTALIGDVAMPPGRYVRLRVTDTGDGMDASTLAHIFEPFFTTKERGEGTGLGLATVYGIVRQSGGAIEVESHPARGTEFRILFPRVEAPERTSSAPPPGSTRSQPGRTLLLAEDEPGVRKVAARILRGAGYFVLEAADGQQALEVAAGYPGSIHALVTDVVMPKLSGPDLARKLLEFRPDTVVLFTSGHLDASVDGEELPVGAAFLPKPFTSVSLRLAVRDLLDATSSSRP